MWCLDAVWIPPQNEVFDYIKAEFEAAGYRECGFPRLVQGESVRKVADEIKDFREGLFWLREYDITPLDVFLNPTG